jgi:hypothetical protein
MLLIELLLKVSIQFANIKLLYIDSIVLMNQD